MGATADRARLRSQDGKGKLLVSAAIHSYSLAARIEREEKLNSHTSYTL